MVWQYVRLTLVVSALAALVAIVPAQDAPKDAPKDPPKEAPKDQPKDAPKDAPKDPPKEAPKEGPVVTMPPVTLPAPAAPGDCCAPAPCAEPCGPQYRTITVTEYRCEPYTYTRTAYRHETREEPYTAYRTECKTETYTAHRTEFTTENYTAYRTECVPVQKTRTVMVQRMVPECVTQTRQVWVDVPSCEQRTVMQTKVSYVNVTKMVCKTEDHGHYECRTECVGPSFCDKLKAKLCCKEATGHLVTKQVWVPCLVTVQVPTTVCEKVCTQEPVTITVNTCKKECRTETYQVTVNKCVSEPKTECYTEMVAQQVAYQACRQVPVTVPYQACRTVQVTVPYQATRCVTVCVPYQETVTATRMVPVCVEKQVPVCDAAPAYADAGYSYSGGDKCGFGDKFGEIKAKIGGMLSKFKK